MGKGNKNQGWKEEQRGRGEKNGEISLPAWYKSDPDKRARPIT
jgi:hypothetical protein